LHSFVRKRDGFVFEDTLSCELQGLQESASVGGRSQGIEVREMFCEYFNEPGALPWQNKRVRMGTNYKNLLNTTLLSQPDFSCILV
jgi:hypothetical protein